MTTARDKIIRYLKNVDYTQTPKEIAQNTKLNPNTVRPELTKLAREGIVCKVSRGYYSINPIYGVGVVVVPPRVQNLLVVAEDVGVSVSSDVVLEFPGETEDTSLRVTIQFGVKRGRVSWRVKAPLGLDLYSLKLCRGLVESECEKRGYVDFYWFARNYEFLWDYLGVRMEGVQIVTLDDLEGTMEKFYNRRYGIRREVRSKEIPLESLIALLHGGLTVYHVVQGVFEIGKQVEKNTEAVKYMNSSLGEILRLLKAILDAFNRQIDGEQRTMHARGATYQSKRYTYMRGKIDGR